MNKMLDTHMDGLNRVAWVLAPFYPVLRVLQEGIVHIDRILSQADKKGARIWLTCRIYLLMCW